MTDVTLESLIQEQKDRMRTLRINSRPPNSVGFKKTYSYKDSESYESWLAISKRFIRYHYPNDQSIDEFEKLSNEKLSPEQQGKLLAILEAFAILPTVITDNSKTNTNGKGRGRETITVTTTINNTNSQTQSQEQSLAVELFIEAIKDDLTGRQIKELKAVVEEADNDLQKARPGILAKLKEFGGDVTSNIIANILTNPMIWGGL